MVCPNRKKKRASCVDHLNGVVNSLPGEGCIAFNMLGRRAKPERLLHDTLLTVVCDALCGGLDVRQQPRQPKIVRDFRARRRGALHC